MQVIDLNCDLGEGMNNDEAIMPYITSANIACGFHAGDVDTMKRTVELCLKYNVAIGAHPSYPDRENFGRTNMQMDPGEVYEIVIQQIETLTAITSASGKNLQHVKPHGALYNMAAKDFLLANAIAKAIKDHDKNLLLFGLPNSEMENAATENGIKFIGEAFADRTYQTDGSLTARTEANALIEDKAIAVKQILQIITEQKVSCANGAVIPLKAATICIHGDGKHAVEFANELYNQLKASGIELRSFR